MYRGRIFVHNLNIYNNTHTLSILRAIAYLGACIIICRTIRHTCSEITYNADIKKKIASIVIVEGHRRHNSISSFPNNLLSLLHRRRIKMRRHDSNRRYYRPGAGCKHVVMYSYWPTVLYGPQSEGSSPAVIFEF